MILKDFQNKKKLLLNTFDELAKFGFIPYEFDNTVYSKELIDKHKQNLEDEKFFISICGAIKSGKSTLLNRWLFNGIDILPTDDGVCTATLSKICYNEKQFVKVFFYNKDEWIKLKRFKINEDSIEKRVISKILPKNNVNYFEKYLQPEIDKSAKKGVYDESLIEEKRLIKSIYNFDDLKEYSAKGGKYTPFIKYVEIFINNKDIKNVIIVDTPGTNDPNILREKITKEWIDQSSAVIMLMYAGQAFTKTDLDFIDKNLSSIPSDKIIFAISKSDSIGNYENVKNYVESKLRNNKDIKDRHLLKNNKEVYPISTIASIMKMKKDNNVELNEDEKAILENAESIDEFIENDGYLPAFYKATDNYLMKEKGKAILEKAKQEIITICHNRINKLNHDIEINSIKNEDIGKSEEEKNNKTKQIQVIRDKIERINKKFLGRSGIPSIEILIKNDVDKKLSLLRKEIKKRYKKWLEDNKVGTIITRSEGELYDIFEDELIKEFENLLDKNLESELRVTYNNFKTEMKNVTKDIISSRMEYLFMPTLELNILSKTARIIFQDRFSSEILNGLCKKFLWIPKTEKTKNNILEKLNKVLILTEQEISNKIKKDLHWHIENNTIVLSKRVKEILNDVSDQLKKLKINIPDIQKEKNKIEKDKKEMETLKKEFEDKFIKIKNQTEDL